MLKKYHLAWLCDCSMPGC